MNIRISAAPLMASALMLGAVSLSAQTPPTSTNAPNTNAMDLLRRTLAAQQANPGKVIRSPAPAPLLITRAELERLYLEGKMTAREHQKALDQLAKDEQARAAESEKLRLLEALHRQQQAAKPVPVATKPPSNRAAAPRETVAPAAKSAPAATVPPPAAEPTAEQKKISEVESRIDEMLRQKAEREKTALTNAAPKATNVTSPAAPLTKRQRMDALLKDLVGGKISDAEYHEKRNKLLAEPD